MDKLYKKLSKENKYFSVGKNIEYGYHHNDNNKHGVHVITGEVDILAIIKKQDYKIIELYEVKTGVSKKRRKSKRQMDRCEEHLMEWYLTIDDIVRKYHVYSRHGSKYQINQL